MTRARWLARALLCGAVALMATACATWRPTTGEVTLSGRMSVQVEAHEKTPASSLSAAFDLRGDARRGELDLSTPFGTVLAKARWQPGEVLLTTPQGESRHEDLAALAQQALGERVPLDALFDWLRGRPWSGAVSRPLSGATERGFEQMGWSVSLARFDEGWITARRSAPPAVTVRARLDRP